MDVLVDLAWGREIYLGFIGSAECMWLGLDLNEEPMDGICVDNQPTPIIKPVSMPNYYQIMQWSILWSFKL